MFNTDVMVSEELPASRQAPYMALAVPVRKREKASMTAGSLKKRCLNIAAEAVTTYVKEEYSLNAMQATDSSLLSSEAVAAQEAYLKVMRTVCFV